MTDGDRTRVATEIYGNEIEDRIYNNRDYDYRIILQDRIDEVAREITEYLKSTDRMQKTIVFCVPQDHAERMRIAQSTITLTWLKESGLLRKNDRFRCLWQVQT